MELEDPFGDDDNDYPVNLQQWQVVCDLEDCFFMRLPQDFAQQVMREPAAWAGNHMPSNILRTVSQRWRSSLWQKEKESEAQKESDQVTQDKEAQAKASEWEAPKDIVIGVEKLRTAVVRSGEIAKQSAVLWEMELDLSKMLEQACHTLLSKEEQEVAHDSNDATRKLGRGERVEVEPITTARAAVAEGNEAEVDGMLNGDTSLLPQRLLSLCGTRHVQASLEPRLAGALAAVNCESTEQELVEQLLACNLANARLLGQCLSEPDRAQARTSFI